MSENEAKSKKENDLCQLTVTAKIRIGVNDNDVKVLLDTMKTFTDACNAISDYIFKTHCLTYRKLHDKLYHSLRDKFKLKSQMAQSAIKCVIARYKSHIEQHPGNWVKIEFKKLQLDLVWNRDYSLTENKFSVNTLEGRIKTPYYSNAMEYYFDFKIYKFGTAKLIHKQKTVKSKDGKKVKHKDLFFLHIPVTFNVQDFTTINITNVVGIDRGINFPVVTYDKNRKSQFFRGGEIKQKRSHYKELRAELQSRGTPSARKRLKAIGSRENRWMSDVNHRISKALVNNNPEGTLFVIEELRGIQKASVKVNKENRYVQVSWPFYDLEMKLIYKAIRHGSTVLQIDPHYTSQTCPICGHIAKGNRDKNNHIFKCKHCGYQSNDDRIGAMNMFHIGMDFIAMQ